MLVEFKVGNFLSVRDLAKLSMVSATGTELVDSNTFGSRAPATPSLVASAAIYGANGAGKSNLIQAIWSMREIVLESARESNASESLPLTPFLLDSELTSDPSEFEITIVANGVRYQYGFSATPERIIEEWLIAFPKARPQRLIERYYDADSDRYEWGGMDKLPGSKQLWQEATRSNALFLSTAVQLNSKALRPVFDWFSDTLHVITSNHWSPGFTAVQCKDAKWKLRVEDFLRAADFGIEGIEINKVPFDPDGLPSDMPDEVRTLIKKELQGQSLHVVKTRHKARSGENVLFDLEMESSGTQKYFSMAGPWLDTLESGYVLVVDELHANLHPNLVRFLVNLFHDKRHNKKSAQLVFSTHDATILSQDVFRRDQIWFVEKDEFNSTRLFPLTDFSPRKGTENLERGYLAGRYGALPVIQELAISGTE